MIAWTVIVALAFIGTAIFGIVRMVQFVSFRGCRPSIGLAALILNIIGLVFGAIYWAIDPLGLNLFFYRQFLLLSDNYVVFVIAMRRLWPTEVTTVGISLPTPFVFCSVLLVILFWLEVLTQKDMNVTAELRRLRVPFITLTAIFISAEILSDILRGVLLNAIWTTIFSIGSTIIQLIIISVSVFVLIARIRKEQRSGFVLSSRLKRMNNHMIALASLSMLTLIAMGMYTLDYFQLYPITTVVMLGIIGIFVTAIAANQINLFQPPGSRRFHSSSESAPIQSWLGVSSVSFSISFVFRLERSQE